MKFRNILTVFAALFLTASCSFGQTKKQEESASLGEYYVEEEQEVQEEVKLPFLVQLDGNTLSLFDVSDEQNTLIKSFEIDTNYYPEDDILELRQGIGAYSKEEGFEILENFVN